MNSSSIHDLFEHLKGLNDILAEGKVYKDFWEHLDDEMDGNGITVQAITEDKNLIPVNITRDDKITVLCHRLTIPKQEIIYFPLSIDIALGQFEIATGSLYKATKCSARLLYNYELHLVDLDFFYEPIHHR